MRFPPFLALPSPSPAAPSQRFRSATSSHRRPLPPLQAARRAIQSLAAPPLAPPTVVEQSRHGDASRTAAVPQQPVSRHPRGAAGAPQRLAAPAAGQRGLPAPERRRASAAAAAAACVGTGCRRRQQRRGCHWASADGAVLRRAAGGSTRSSGCCPASLAAAAATDGPAAACRSTHAAAAARGLPAGWCGARHTLPWHLQVWQPHWQPAGACPGRAGSGRQLGRAQPPDYPALQASNNRGRGMDCCLMLCSQLGCTDCGMPARAPLPACSLAC